MDLRRELYQHEATNPVPPPGFRHQIIRNQNRVRNHSAFHVLKNIQMNTHQDISYRIEIVLPLVLIQINLEQLSRIEIKFAKMRGFRP